jgi:UDP-4-amino-4,6-dideoxy-L-N-acetyl-beta-L-altrosamine transaminase
MIPFSPRGRERNALQTRSLRFDAQTLERLEARVSAYHECAHAVAFSTPEAALTAALHAIGIRAGDEIITTALAPLFHYTAVSQLGAKLRYGDIGLNGNLDIRRLDDPLDAGVKAVLLAAFEGVHAARPELETGISLIEDVSASLTPARISGTGIWSLESVMPEGVEKTGFVLTDSTETAAQLKRFRRQGYEQGTLWNYDLATRGTDTALSAIAAAVALAQMEAIASACDRRRVHMERLDERLKGNRLFDTIGRNADDLLRSYPLLLTPPLYCPKEDIFAALQEQGIEASVCCKPVYRTTAYKDDGIRLPVTEDFYKALLQLPCHHRLNSAETDAVAKALLEAVDVYAYRGCSF